MSTTNLLTLPDLRVAEEGSFYTILGAGGDIQEWITGYEDLLSQAGIGKPVMWYVTTGRAINEYAAPSDERDAFQPDLHVLLFPLDSLDVGKLALFKIQMGDRWFDDIVQNMRD